MYRRKIENVFQSWLDNASHKPLVVKGVRQCNANWLKRTTNTAPYTAKPSLA